MGSLKEQRAHLSAMREVASEMKGWRPQVEVLVDVEAVPTIFPSYDLTIGGGHPISRVCVVHGPSAEGKTSFVLGLMLSFLQGGHFAGLLDAERTTPAKWVTTLMGKMAEHPGFLALPASTYENARASVREYCERIAKARDAGRLLPSTSGIVVVDSIRKLVPERLWDELSKGLKAEKKEAHDFLKRKGPGVDGMSGRAAQYKAALNAQWMDELVPLMADTRTTIVIVARETDETDKHGNVRQKVGGGVALNYESSLRIRIRHEWLRRGERENQFVVGERHDVEIHKSKVHAKKQVVEHAVFHTSNGMLEGVPAGFDRPRDVLELAVDCGVVEQKGSWFSFDGQRLGQGEDHAVALLHGEPSICAAIEKAVRAARSPRHQ
jgi:recombination protein RecA